MTNATNAPDTTATYIATDHNEEAIAARTD